MKCDNPLCKNGCLSTAPSHCDGECNKCPKICPDCGGSGVIEMWKPIIGYEGRYSISDMGRIRSEERKKKNNRTHRERILSERISSTGYQIVTLYRDNHEKVYRVHRLVAEAFIQFIDSNHKYVNHKDGNKLNNKAENLEWCTAKENINHAITTGLKPSKTTGKIKVKYIDIFGDDIVFDSIRSASKMANISDTTMKRWIEDEERREWQYS